MKRIKEISYALVLGTMVIVVVQTSLFLVTKPEDKQRIPVISAANLQLSAQPYYLIRQLLGSELLEVKDQKFIQSIRSMLKRSKKQQSLDNIQLDFKKSVSIILVNDPSYKKSLLHFHAVNQEVNPKQGKHYVQIGQDVFFFPNNTVNAADVAWLKKHISWQTIAIPDKQLILSQQEDGIQRVQRIRWNQNELHVSLLPTGENRSLIISPRYFHYSHEVPAHLLARIPEDLKMRCLLVQLKRISINYENGKLTEDEQFAFAPSFEALLEYESTQDLTIALAQFKEDFPNLIWTENTVQIGTQTYYLKETSPKSLYICSDKSKFCPSGIPTLTRCQTGFFCKGELARLTSIQNTGWAGLVLDMIPAFRASKTLFDETTGIRMHKDELVLSFKKGHLVTHDFLQAFMAYNQE